MPKGHSWFRRPKRVANHPYGPAASHSPEPQPEPERAARSGAEAPPEAASGAEVRLQIFAKLGWLQDYTPILEMERFYNGQLQEDLQDSHLSGYARRLIRSGGERGDDVLRRQQGRVGDVVGMLQRGANVHAVPFSQAVRAVSWLYCRVSKPVWETERRNRRIVGKAWARRLVQQMARCKPPPPFEPDMRLVSIAFDQTYARGSGTTGVSQYAPIRTVDADGEKARRPPRAARRRRAASACGSAYP